MPHTFPIHIKDLCRIKATISCIHSTISQRLRLTSTIDKCCQIKSATHTKCQTMAWWILGPITWLNIKEMFIPISPWTNQIQWCNNTSASSTVSWTVHQVTTKEICYKDWSHLNKIIFSRISYGMKRKKGWFK